ncbi:hypothetical protein RRG08_047113 [Elysia crispata]|uniref:Uncharacterized protein n=1 Tax=Elysia crispata TaxID=231223 RepID=A0AAE1E2J7_9GAST|nr:hypothetical protein RRG08_047113 [Elysia crispata]
MREETLNLVSVGKEYNSTLSSLPQSSPSLPVSLLGRLGPEEKLDFEPSCVETVPCASSDNGHCQEKKGLHGEDTSHTSHTSHTETASLVSLVSK